MPNPTFPTPDQLADPGTGAQSFPTPDQLSPAPRKGVMGTVQDVIGSIGEAVRGAQHAVATAPGVRELGEGWRATLGHEEPVIVKDLTSAEANAYRSAGFIIDDGGYVRRKNGEPITVSQADLLMTMFGFGQSAPGSAGARAIAQDLARTGGRAPSVWEVIQARRAARAVKPVAEQVAEVARPVAPPEPTRPPIHRPQELPLTRERAIPEQMRGLPQGQQPLDLTVTEPIRRQPPGVIRPGQPPHGEPWIPAAANPAEQDAAEAAALARQTAHDLGAPDTPISTQSQHLDDAIHAASEEGGFNIDRALTRLQDARNTRQIATNIGQFAIMLRQEAAADEMAMYRMLNSGVVKEAERLPDKALRAIRDYGEDKTIPVTQEQRELFHRTLSPLVRETSDASVRLRDLATKTGDELLHQIADDLWMPRISERYGLPRRGSLFSKSASVAKPYDIYTAVTPDGTRSVVKWQEGQLYALDADGKAKGLAGLAQRPKIGDVIDTKQGFLTIRRGTQKEIEGLSNERYIANPFRVVAHKWMDAQRALRAYEFWTRLKGDENFLKYAVQSNNPNEVRLTHPNWVTTTFPYFRGWFMDPALAAKFDEIHAVVPLNMRRLEEMNHYLITLNFVLPTVHAPNQLAIWATTMLQTMVAHPGTVPKTVGAFLKTVGDVASFSPRYEEWVRAGHPGLFARSRMADFYNAAWRQSVAGLSDDPQLIRQFADSWGTPLSEVKRGIDYLGTWTTWFADDIVRGHVIHSLTDAGWSTERAIKYANRYVPDYKIPAMLNHSLGRLLFMFAGYHMSNLRTLITSLPHSMNYEELSTSSARLATLGFIYFWAYPMADTLVQKALGEPKASMRRAGVYSIPENFMKFMDQKETLGQFLQTLFSLSPVLHAGIDIVTGRDPFTGQLFEKGTPVEQIRQAAGSIAPAVLFPVGTIMRKGIPSWLLSSVGINTPGTSSGQAPARTSGPRLPGLPRLR